MTSTSFYKRALQRFSVYVKDSPASKLDPNALTMAGLMSLSAGSGTRGVELLEQAMEVGSVGKSDTENPGSVRPKRWDLEPSCLLGLCQQYYKQGQRKRAEAMARKAAFEIDNPDAYLVLAELLPPHAPERERCLTKAAVSGVPQAGRQLSELLGKKAAKTPDKEQALELLRMAGEWERVASGDPPRAAVAAGDSGPGI